MNVAQRDRQRIGDVGRLGDIDKAQLSLDRLLDLPLRRPAVTGEQLLHLGRRVVDDVDVRLAGRQADDAPSVSHEDRRPRTLVMRIQLLDGHGPGAERCDDISDPRVNVAYPLRQTPTRGTTNDARFAQFDATCVAFQHGVSGDVQPRVDAQNPMAAFHLFHGFPACGWGPVAAWLNQATIPFHQGDLPG